jgi:hypothetical protein
MPSGILNVAPEGAFQVQRLNSIQPSLMREYTISLPRDTIFPNFLKLRSNFCYTIYIEDFSPITTSSGVFSILAIIDTLGITTATAT